MHSFCHADKYRYCGAKSKSRDWVSLRPQWICTSIPKNKRKLRTFFQFSIFSLLKTVALFVINRRDGHSFQFFQFSTVRSRWSFHDKGRFILRKIYRTQLGRLEWVQFLQLVIGVDGSALMGSITRSIWPARHISGRHTQNMHSVCTPDREWGKDSKVVVSSPRLVWSASER